MPPPMMSGPPPMNDGSGRGPPPPPRPPFDMGKNFSSFSILMITVKYSLEPPKSGIEAKIDCNSWI